MRMYAMFTESHRQMMYKYFLPSLIPNEYLLTLKQSPQKGNGNFGTRGFIATVAHTFNILLDAIDENYGSYFVFSDVDVQFFGPTKAILLDAIADCDFAAQGDTGQVLCTGFFICRANDTMRQVFIRSIKTLAEHPTQATGDQFALNCHKSEFKWKILDEQQFWAMRHKWRGEPLEVPDNILMHHANWTIGISNKMEMLRQVKLQVESKRSEVGA